MKYSVLLLTVGCEDEYHTLNTSIDPAEQLMAPPPPLLSPNVIDIASAAPVRDEYKAEDMSPTTQTVSLSSPSQNTLDTKGKAGLDIMHGAIVSNLFRSRPRRYSFPGFTDILYTV